DPYGRPVSTNQDAAIDIGYVRRHQQYAEERLHRMVVYAESERCRRAVILEYFGEQAAEDCGACDNCLGEEGAGTDGLLAALTTLRRDLAQRNRREADELMDLHTLQDLANHRPRTQEELLQTRGIGEVKTRW